MVVVLVPLSSIDLWLSASLQVDLNLGVILDYDFNKLMVNNWDPINTTDDALDVLKSSNISGYNIVLFYVGGVAIW